MSGEEISEGGEKDRQDRNGEWEGKEGGWREAGERNLRCSGQELGG